MNVKELGTGKRNILVVEDMEADNRMLLDILKEHYMVLCQDLAQNKMRSSATKLLTENRPSHTFFRSR